MKHSSLVVCIYCKAQGTHLQVLMVGEEGGVCGKGAKVFFGSQILIKKGIFFGLPMQKH